MNDSSHPELAGAFRKRRGGFQSGTVIEGMPDDLALAVSLPLESDLIAVVFEREYFESGMVDCGPTLEIATQVVAGPIAKHEVRVLAQGHPLGERPKSGRGSRGSVGDFCERRCRR